ncbi:FAD-dependent oxidoreductase [Pseudoleptotrichia goodfellowii]|uniref:Pyridine nucleotide-disulfide oxidoreductase dimerisation protein n=1 Tax=Pseudoleptotrichia goodfellowii TaxID=157692 RepID=A0A510JC01_9FUSO|nr:FAD-dependent oxidoreductase [Pseudoleptotrichia goodfellowii]BBM36840.1 pyridine nucleotide-disulfide oxidoreductase dimerisation protein [Pseudoleptotrichia goodfellowii]
MKKYDAVIIGFGKGGKTLAGFLAGKGQNVALIEKSDKMYGGTCINVGCIPSKKLVNSTKVLKNKGLNSIKDKKNFYTESINNKNALIGALRGKNYEILATKDTIDIYNGTGSFVSKNIVNVDNNGENVQIEGEKIFINTGSMTVIPDIKGLKESKYVYTSTTLMDLEELPEKLVIIGAGYIGLEFASMYSEFGSEVTVIDAAEKLLPREDEEIAKRVKSILEAKGIKFLLKSKIEEVFDKNGKGYVKVSEEEVEVNAILVAVGRKPNTEGLNLEAAEVKIDEKGAVIVNETLQTTADNIWAMGDVKGGLQFTYISLDDFRIIRDNIYGNGNRTVNDRNVVPYSVFVNPPLSRVGMTESEAVAKGHEVKTGRLEAMAIPKAKIEGQTDGLLKTVIDIKTDKILGCTLLCNTSHEMINIVAAAMKAEQKYTFLKDMIFTHPTMSEALNDLFGSVK